MKKNRFIDQIVSNKKYIKEAINFVKKITLLILNTNASVLNYFQSKVRNYYRTNYFNFRQKLK